MSKPSQLKVRTRACENVEDTVAVKKAKTTTTINSSSSSSSSHNSNNSNHTSKGPSASTGRFYACTYPECTKTYKKPCRLEEHIRSHTNERPFACEYPECNKRFLRATHLQAHYRTHDPNHERAFICDIDTCQKRFATRTRLDRHKTIHYRPFKCQLDGCNEAFNSEVRLHFHLCRHDNRLPYACPHPECDMAFRTPYDLNRHFIRHSNSRIYMCGRPGCDQSFSQLSLLQQHIRQDHILACDQCGETFKRPEYLKQHHLTHNPEPEIMTCPYPDCTNITHEQKARFECEVCGQQFGYKHVLQKHSRQHICSPNNDGTLHKTLDINTTNIPLTGVSSIASSSSSSLVDDLTGAGYAEDPKRRFFCLVPGCLHRFGRFYDLDRHCRSVHPELNGGYSVDPHSHDSIATLLTDAPSPLAIEQTMREVIWDDMALEENDELVQPIGTNNSIESILDIYSTIQSN
ncbi:hypothetical protein BDF19DRAFT_433423 [Syncephalis fuscata]|nr:hypothetical protein BDF19DRAFT_433423 [Syncephalis fuscata]